MMEPYEEKIKKIINADIDIPIHYKNMIRKTLYECEKKKERKIKNTIKIIATTCAGIIMATGIVYGSYVICEKIWREPKQYSHDEFINMLPTDEFSYEEKISYITEEQAKKRALIILNKLGYENQEINRIELKRSYSSYASAYYVVKTKYDYEQGLMVTINAENGEFDHFEDMELKYKSAIPDEITKEEAEKIGIDFYNKIGFLEGEYELYIAKKVDQAFREKNIEEWQITFCKKVRGCI